MGGEGYERNGSGKEGGRKKDARKRVEGQGLVFYRVTVFVDVMRPLSVTHFCDWSIAYHQDPDHLEAFSRPSLVHCLKKSFRPAFLIYSPYFLPSNPGKLNI